MIDEKFGEKCDSIRKYVPGNIMWFEIIILNWVFSGEDVYEYDYTDFYPEGQLDYGNQEIGMDLYDKKYGWKYGYLHLGHFYDSYPAMI